MSLKIGSNLRRSAGVESTRKSFDVFWFNLVGGVFHSNTIDIEVWSLIWRCHLGMNR